MRLGNVSFAKISIIIFVIFYSLEIFGDDLFRGHSKAKTQSVKAPNKNAKIDDPDTASSAYIVIAPHLVPTFSNSL